MFTDVLQGNRNGRFFDGNEMRKRFLPSLTWNWATLSRRKTISRSCWRWKLRRFCAAWPKMGAEDCGQRLKANCPGIDVVFKLPNE